MCTSACVSVNVCGCTLVANPCLGLFFQDFVGNMLHEAIHLQVMVWSHWCCALHSPQASPWLTSFIPYLAENSFITKKWEKKPPVNSKELCRNFIWFKITTKTTQHDSTILLVNYTDECIYFFWIKKKTDQWFFSNKYVFVCFEEQHCGARAASGPFVKAPPSRWETAHTAPNCWWAYF